MMALTTENLEENKKKDMARELKNKVQFIRGNSQILQEIWKDTYKIFKNHHSKKDIRLAGLSLEEVNRIFPRMLNGNIEGSTKIIQIADHLDDSSEVSKRPESRCFFHPERRYRLISRVGFGGSSEVFKAEDKVLKRIVALKILTNKRSKFQFNVQEFIMEAQIAASLSHPNLVTIFDINQINNKHFIAMEFIEGINLFKIINQKRNIKIEKIIFVMENVLRALEYIHNNGLIHRDVKPQNVMVCNSMGVKLMDFGLVVPNAGGKNKDEEFRVGTPYYMSPEQIRGSMIDHRTDIYSLGVTLFHLVTGQTPFQRKDVFFQHLFEPVPVIEKFRKNVPSELVNIIERCMAKKPEERYQKIKEILIELEKVKLRYCDSNLSSGILEAGWDQIQETGESIEVGAQIETEKIKIGSNYEIRTKCV